MNKEAEYIFMKSLRENCSRALDLGGFNILTCSPPREVDRVLSSVRRIKTEDTNMGLVEKEESSNWI